MAKSPDAFRTISEVADWLDAPAHVLRFWESKFTQIKPVKRAGGRRYYRPEDMALLGGIKTLLHEQGMTIKGVQKLLREQGAKHVASLGPQPINDDGAAVETVFPEPAQVIVAPIKPRPIPDQPVLAPATQPAAVVPPPAPAHPPPTPATPVPEPVTSGATGLLTILAGADKDRLQARRARIQPLVQRLIRLQDRLFQDRA
ncbi:MAG: MerR family transcriptional regulator [Rhodobacterales bacterium]|jgi:resuscitation-promoting factor RpfA|nr:MerR family transcriptional regulator [Rhodobacterales bacterium]